MLGRLDGLARLRTPCSSISTSSPGASSRSSSAPTRSSAHVSEARTHSPCSPRPRQSGRKPCGSRKPISLPFGERDHRERAVEPRHRAGDRVLERRRVVRDQRGDHLGVGGRRERDAVGGELVAQLGRVDEVAVVPERDGAPAAVLDQRLRVRPLRRAGRRVARVADRDVAVQAAQLLLVEDLRDEAHVAQHGQAAVVGDGDPGRLLAAVLEREQPEVGDARDVALGGADAEDAAHQRDRPELAQVRPVRLARRPGSPSRTAASPSALNSRPLKRRGLRERVGEAAVADVVGERELRRVAPEPADQLDLVALGQPDAVAGPPAARDLAHVGHEPDAADHRRRRNRAAVGLVVERDVARDDRNPERLRRLGDRPRSPRPAPSRSPASPGCRS